MLSLSILAFAVLILDWGFVAEPWVDKAIYWFYWWFNLSVMLGLVLRIFFLQKQSERGKHRRRAQYVMLGLSLLVFLTELFAPAWLESADGDASKHLVIYLIIILLFFEEISERLFVANTFVVHPALIFSLSFVVLIFFGAAMLMLPTATTKDISFVDALFTSTSAVSVTGLAVKNTGEDFTRFGQTIILALIQIGGLGMLTFTNLFGLLFRGGTSFQNQLFIKDTLNADKLSTAFRTLVKIVLLTFGIEAVGAALIFINLDPAQFSGLEEAVFFSVFHAISAFCNAGFSTLGNSLYEEGYREHYVLHLVVAGLIVAGGLGYTIVFNYLSYAKNWLRIKYRRYLRRDRSAIVLQKPIITLNTRIALSVSLALWLIGFVLFLSLEFEGVLKDLSWTGKIAQSIFGSITPRTAGFNTVDMGALTTPTVMFYLLLMWIGASPGSTGGGIKTSTIGVATLNMYDQIIGRERMELAWKEIPSASVQRAFGIITLSLAFIGLALSLLVYFEPQMEFRMLAFEVFSAYSTVGLSIGSTSEFSTPSKFVLMMTMFLGRVGTLTFFIGLIRSLYRRKATHYTYPKEDIFM